MTPNWTLTIIFVAIVAVGLHLRTARGEPLDRLPSEMLGAWCFDKSLTRALGAEGEFYYSRSNDADDCANRGGIEIRKDGSVSCRFGCFLACKFDKIESVGGGAYHVSETCKRLRGEERGEEEDNDFELEVVPLPVPPPPSDHSDDPGKDALVMRTPPEG